VPPLEPMLPHRSTSHPPSHAISRRLVLFRQSPRYVLFGLDGGLPRRREGLHARTLAAHELHREGQHVGHIGVLGEALLRHLSDQSLLADVGGRHAGRRERAIGRREKEGFWMAMMD
jgi:hypothetical protein